MRALIANLLVLHTILGCCFHHLGIQDDCPPTCACAGDAAVSDNCECSHHPHNGHLQTCTAAYCAFTNTENLRVSGGYVVSAPPRIDLDLHSRNIRFHAIAHSAVCEPSSVPRHILLENFLV